jgi:multidrug efflux system outer membrane protein
MKHLAPTLALALSLPAVASAQEAPDGPRVALDLREALRRGAADPPAVLVALARVGVATAQIASAEAAYRPSVTAAGSGTVGFSDSPVLQDLRYQSVNFGASAGVTARFPIYDFGRTSNAVESATRARTAAREDLRAARTQAVSAVAVSYLSVLSDQEAVRAAQAVVAQREAHLRIAEGLVTAGSRPPIERVRAQLDLEVGRLDLTATEARERTDRAGLATALGVDPLSELAVSPVDEAMLEASDDAARASAEAVAGRPEFAASRARLLQSESQAAAARAGRNPVLSGQASATANYSARLSGQGAFGLSEQVQGGLNLTWPIYDAAVRANIDVADANVASARAALAQQSLLVRAAAVQAAVSLRAARVTLDQTERLAATATANLQQAEGRYRSGAAPLLETVDAQAADAGARFAVVRARLAFQVARVNLLTTTGAIERLAR